MAAIQSQPNVAQLVSMVLTRLSETVSDGRVNGYGKDVYELNVGNRELAQQLARFFNMVLRYQTCPEALQAIAAEVDKSSSYYRTKFREEAAPTEWLGTVFHSGLTESDHNLTLTTNLPVRQLIGWMREALLHPERGQDQRAEDGWRRVHIAGLDLTMGVLCSPGFTGELLSQARDPLEQTAILADLECSRKTVGKQMTKMIPGIGLEELAAMERVIPSVPDLQHWNPDPSTDTEAQQFQDALARFLRTAA